MVKWLFFIQVSSFLIYSMLAGCAPGNNLSKSPEIPPPVAAPDQKQSWEQKWEKVVSQARQEGTVVVYASPTSALARDTSIRSFKEKYGLDMQFLVGNPTEMAQKILRERNAGLYTTDIYIGGSTTFAGLFKPAGVLTPLDSALILPEVIDTKYWLNNKLEYLDQEHMILSFGIMLGPQFIVNKQMVAPGEVTTFKDFLNPKWKGKIVLHDPTGPGTGQKSMAVIGSSLLGWDAIRAMAEQEPIIIRDQRLQTEWVARGRYPLAYGALLGTYAEFEAAGAPIQLGVAPDATYITSVGDILALIDKAPHPNAATLFINWQLSREGQTAIYKQMNTASRRIDVPTEGINPILLPKPGVNYFNSDSEEWLKKQDGPISEVKRIFAPLVK